ncbi:MAG: SpoIID/LytB domain-containing protein [Nitrospinota bacterium]
MIDRLKKINNRKSKRMGLRSVFITLCLFILFPVISEGTSLIRVAIKQSVDSCQLSVKEGTKIIDAASNRSFAVKTPLQVNIKALNPGMAINNRKFGEIVKILSPHGSLIKVDKDDYRGNIEIRKDDGGSLLIINELNVEEYLKGVLNEEISAKWHPESLKAQAVVARTYALYQKENRKDNPYHMEATIIDQVYGGAKREDERTNKAVEDTRGIVLTYEGKLAKAFYHSVSGGVTEDVTVVWGGEGENYLKGVKCNFDTEAPNYQWETEIDVVDIEMALSKNSINIDGILSIEPLSFTSSKRIAELQIRHKNGAEKISGVDFRKIIGYETIKSTMFKIREGEGSFIFYGRGSGHGVGLCQWGAKGMAEKGYSYINILKYYYPGIEIKRIK